VITVHDAAGDQKKIEEERKHRLEEEEKLYKEMEAKMQAADKAW
jgi:Skp family chaperone for outer membrane proteins